MTMNSYGYDGTVDEVAAAKMSRYAGAVSAFAGDPDFKPTIVATTDRTVQFAPGEAYGHGILTTSDAVTNLQFATTTSTRWDTVVLRRNWQPVAGTTTLMILPGTSAKAIASSLQNNPGVIADQPVALVRLQSGQSLPQEIVDLRPNPSKVIMVKDILALPAAPLGTVAELVGTPGRFRRQLDSSLNPAWARQDRRLRFAAGPVAASGQIKIPDRYTWCIFTGTDWANTLGVSRSGRSLVVPYDGIYQLAVNFQVAGGAGAGRVKAMIWLNPSSDEIPGDGKSAPAGGSALRNATQRWAAGVPQDVEASKITELSAGDRLMFAFYHDTNQDQYLFAAAVGGQETANTYITIDYLGAA